MDPESTRHDLRDELESALHVLLYTSVRYRASYLPEEDCEDLKTVFIRHFDSRSATVQGRTSGGRGKYDFFQPTGPAALSQEGLEKFLNEPHASLIETLRRLFVPLYSTERQLKLFSSMDQSRDSALEVLKTSNRFIEIIEEHLEMDGWTENDVSDELRGCDKFFTEARGLIFAARRSSLLRANIKRASGSAGVANATPASLPSMAESNGED